MAVSTTNDHATHGAPFDSPWDRSRLLAAFRAVREQSLRLCEPLAPEDMVPQSMADASPTKWHLAHTTWFFEALVLRQLEHPQAWFREEYAYLFNSYYNALGPQYPRPRRGVVTRPTVSEVMDYRADVEGRVAILVENGDEHELSRLAPVIELGLHHEQQHQELILTDIKHLLAQNPTYPIYAMQVPRRRSGAPPLRWHAFPGGPCEVGHEGPSFAFDNEKPRHSTLVSSFELAGRLVTAGEFQEFIRDGGYERPELWLSEGWATVQQQGWQAPLYWLERDGTWWHFTLSGLRPTDADEPLCHVSFFEAAAFAEWAGARLPTEFEWERASLESTVDGTFAEDGLFHPAPARDGEGPSQLFGDCWEWTSSAYAPYPGYRPPAGAVGEYNGKFMCNQYVLRGGSCATPRSHIRPTYRNFWPTATRFQFAGIRLARDT